MGENENSNQILRQILDERSFNAFCNLQLINPEKSKSIKVRLLEYFRRNSRIINHDAYLNIVDSFEKQCVKTEVEIKRRNTMFELDDIE